jgi:uncharacterized protein YqeY
MPLVDTINDQLKTAMRAQDKARLVALRNIRAAFILGMKEDGADTLPDEKATALLRSLAKQRQDSITEYQKAKREDLAAAEAAELAVIEEFLPKLADEATTRAWVDQAIASTGAKSKADMGRVMGALMSAHKAELDGKLANRLVAERLA